MKRFTFVLFFSLFVSMVLFLAACDLPGKGADPCLQPQLQTEVEKIHKQMRAFDDTSQVISNTPRDQVNDGIIKLQAIRREAEDLEVPYCLLVLKTFAVGHMNAMIDTLLAFTSGVDVAVINYDLSQAQLQQEKYYEERARLLGVTYMPEPTITPFPTMIPTEIYTPGSDACAPGKLPAEVERVNNLMRAFDDWSSLALNTPKQGLSDVISNLQSIRRQAQDLAIPECLQKLKQYQLSHMETVINTLLAFLSSSDSVLVNQGILLARSQHDQYNQEYARLLGLTIVPAGTPLPQIISQGKNPGTAPVNIRRYPVNNAEILAEIGPANAVPLVGKSPDGAWVLVYLPDGSGKVGWASAELLEITDLGVLPEMTPIP
jgi:hypothetical protein